MKVRFSRRRSAAMVMLGLIVASSSAWAQDPGWDWMAGPYAWGAGIGTDMRTVRPPTDASGETSFSDIIDKLDGVFMVRVEGRSDRYGVFADFIYLGLADQTQRRVLSTSTDLDTRLLDAAFSVRLSGDREAGLDLFAGVRYIDVDVTVRFEPDNPEFETRTLDVGKTYVDLLMGGRYAWRFSDRWGMTLGVDASMGETEGTWSASAMASYRTRNGAWLFGYRYLEAELGNSNADVTIDMSGPVVGYGFRF